MASSMAEVCELATALLRSRLKRVEERQEEVRKDPRGEPVHQLRVAARRLAAALFVFGPVVRLPGDCRVRPFRRVERCLGALRDLDVLEESVRRERETATEYASLAAYQRVLEGIATDRDDALRDADRALDRPGYDRACAALHAWLAAPRFAALADVPLSAVAPDLLLPTLSATLLHPGWQLGRLPEPDDPDAGNLHALRRRLKSLRYRVECLEEWYGAAATAWLTELHGMQDTLGAWHDEGLLLDRLHRAEAPESCVEAARVRARLALAPWPASRQRYLDSLVRDQCRRLLCGAERAAPDAATA